MPVDVVFTPYSDGQYLVQRVISSITDPRVVEVAVIPPGNTDPLIAVEEGVLINVGAGNVINKVLKIPGGIGALEIQVRYHDANRSVKVRIFNSMDEMNYETTATEEFEIVDAVQIIKFRGWQVSRFVKVQFEAFTQNCTISAKARGLLLQ